MKKFNYPIELLEQIEFLTGKDSELYRACERGEDIHSYIKGWNKERFFTCEEILNINVDSDWLNLKAEAKRNIKKRECYELYMNANYEEIRPLVEQKESLRNTLKVAPKQDSLIGKKVAPTATQEEIEETSPSFYKDDVSESLAPTKSEIRKSFEGLFEIDPFTRKYDD